MARHHLPQVRHADAETERRVTEVLNASAGEKACTGCGSSSQPSSVDRRRFFGLATMVSAGALVATGCGDGVLGVPEQQTAIPGVLPTLDPKSYKELDRIGGVAVIDTPGYGRIAVERTGTDSYRAFSLVCPHQGTLVTQIVGGGYKCPNHGALFTIDGKWSGGKTTGDLPELSIAVDAGMLVIGETPTPPPPSAPPVIAVSPAAEVFTAVKGAAEPPPQYVTVTNGGAGTLADLGVVVGYADGQPTGWLTAAIDNPTAPAIITLTAKAADIEPGVYVATMQVTGRTASNGPIPVPVTFVVSDRPVGPVVQLSPQSLSFATTQGGSALPAQTVQVLNAGGGSLKGIAVGTVSYGAGASGWLTVSRGADSAPSSLSVRVNASGLSAGTYTATVPITGTNAIDSTLLVSFIVEAALAAPDISLTPSAVSFALVDGDPSPAPTRVFVTNAGDGSLTGLNVGSITYVSGGNNWIAAALDQTTAPASLTITPATSGLAVGTHTARVTVRSSVATAPRDVLVTCQVTDRAVPPSIMLSSTTLAFTTTAGSSPSAQSVSISNSGGGSLAGIAVGAVTYGGGASGWLTANVSQPTAPATLTVSVSSGSLAAGTYTATIPVSASGAANSPRSLTVTLTVTATTPPPTPTMSLSSSAYNLSAATGASPAAQTLTVTNTGGGSLAGVAAGAITYGAGATGWLTVTSSGSTAPVTMTLAVASNALAAGTYTASFQVSATGVGAQTVTITLIISGTPSMSLSSTTASFTAAQGASSPPSQTITVTNGGGGTLSGVAASAVTYGAGATGWLTVSSSGSTAPSTLTLAAATGSLTAGSYTATFTVSATGVPSQTVTVSVTVTGTPTMTLSSTAPTFSAGQGASPPSQTITVTNSGSGTLAGIATGAVSYGAGATGWLTVTKSGSTAPVSLTLAVASGALAAGTYTATFAVSATGVTAQVVTVSITITAAASITLSTSTATFSAASGATPTAQTITISNGGGGSLTGLSYAVAYGTGNGWLSGSTLSSTTAPSILTVRPATTGLAAGTYTATITVSGTGVAPKTISVTLTVTAAGLAVVIANWPALANVGGVAGSVGNVSSQPTAVVRTGANTFSAYSMRCPHQGTTCVIANWRSTGSTFHCPNHDAIFNAQGVCMPAGGQQTTNLVARTVSYNPGDTTLYIT